MRITLINPRDTGQGRHKQKCYPPLGLLYLGTALQDAGHTVHVVEGNAYGLSDEQIAQEVARSAPDLIGVPVLAQTAFQVHHMLRTVRQHWSGGHVVLGGVQATALPDELLTQFDHADFILRGEAERSIVALCEALQTGGPLDAVKGLTYRKNGVITHNGAAAHIDVRRARLWPNRQLVERAYREGRYFTLLERSRPVESLISARGCPCGCRYCYNTQKRFLVRSAEDVVAEVVSSYERGVRHLEFVDDNFTLNRPRTIRIFDMLAREVPGMRIVAKSRPEQIDRELLKKARQAGVYQFSFGMESGVQAILDAMGRGHDVADNANAARLCKEAGVNCHASWVFGFPGETPETIHKTVRFIVAIKPETVNLNLLRPYPGTDVYEQAREDGTLMGRWSALEPTVPWVRLPWMNRWEDLSPYLDWAKKRVFFRPWYAATLGAQMLRNANLTMARYALVEAAHVILRKGPVHL